MSGNCGWWIRWLHRRLRRADEATMWPAIRDTALRLEQAKPMASQDAGMAAAQRAWHFFRMQDGQEHWRCECAKAEVDSHV